MQADPPQQLPKYSQLFTKEQMQLIDCAPVVEADELDYVYAPNDDTFLILSTLKQEVASWGPDQTICEVGSGSGIISANVHRWLLEANKSPLLHFSIDINMDASSLSARTYAHHQLSISQINCSLFRSLRLPSLLQPSLILFNPPYVPVEQEELDNEQKYLKAKLQAVRKGECSRKKERNMIAFSYMGGLDGLAVTRRLISSVTWDCQLYFIVMG
jgi:release factor glutamine methyltransferase